MRPAARVLQVTALSGAAVLLGAAVWPYSVAAQAATAAPPGVYTGQVSATGVQYTMDSSPSFFPSITDVIDVRIPAGLSQLSSGQATATGSLLYPGGAGSGPAL